MIRSEPEEPSPTDIMLRLLQMYGDPNNRTHINPGMKRMFQEYYRDLGILYGTLSRKQFQSIFQYLIYEFRKIQMGPDEVREFFAPIIRTGKAKRLKDRRPKSYEEDQETRNTLEPFLQKLTRNKI